MPRLGNLKPRLGSMPLRMGYAQGDERGRSRHRDSTQPWRRWYKTSRWQKLRWSVLVRDLFTCQRCKRVEPDPSQLVADHKRPHRSDPSLFWDAGNIECLCRVCHDGAKQREERRAT